MEPKEYLRTLYPKLLAGDISDQELEWLSVYFEGKDYTDLTQMVREELLLSDVDTVTSAADEAVLSRVYHALEGKIGTEHAGKRSVRFYPAGWYRFGIAAAVALIAIGIYFFKAPRHPERVSGSQYVNDVAPGRHGATLTLANGRKIKLTDASNGKLANEAGVTVTKTANGQLVYEILTPKELRSKSVQDADKVSYNTLTTAKGETYQVKLPDGSEVWLNAASSLTYASNLGDGSKRTVSLKGEGYFEIAKDPSRPFVVESAGQQVKVLGTHFNINTYADEPETKTTLLEGKIRLNGKLILKPGEQASTTRNGFVSVKEVNVSKAVAWKNGKFVFTSEPMESIMRKLSRWYNVEVVYEGDFSDMPFTGSMSRTDQISKILNKISLTNAVHFKIEERRITVMR
ncbi:FecR family protein [Pedobacter sp. PWIIR3]